MRRGGLFLHRCYIAPAAAVDQEPGTGCRREPGGEDGGRRHGAQVVRLAGGLAGLYPPLDSEGRDDMSVWLAEIFF